METASQNVNVEGEHNQVITVGNDFVIVQREDYVQQKTYFFPLKLDPYKSPPFVSPENILEIAKSLYKQRMILLGGSPEVDKDGLARHLAWYLSRSIEMEKKDGLEHVAVAEWDHDSDPQSLLLGIQEAKEPTIFVLSRVSPADVSYDPLSLEAEVRKQRHFVVISTDVPCDVWRISTNGTTPPYWVELSPDALYSPRKLTDELIARLEDGRDALPVELARVDLIPTAPLAGDITIRKAASELKTPKNIGFFVELLCQEQRPLSEAVLEELLSSARDSGRVFTQWFLSTREPREQTAALGLGLFEGLFDDQFFTALEMVTQEAWRPRDPKLVFPDYCDLENLKAFYNFVESDDGASRIESRNAGQRKILFDLLWKRHRRQLLASLPVLAHLVSNSVKRRDADPALYGSYLRRRTLRESVSDSISDLGLVSPAAVEACLIQLAAEREFAVQAVAAKAMARWREYDRDEALLEMLARWQTEAGPSNLIKASLERREAKSSDTPQAFLGAMVALIVGYAARYDPRNQLSKEFVKLFVDLADDRNELVRERFKSFTLPTLVSQHVGQLGGELRRMVRYKDLIPVIGASLASTYRFRSEEIIQLLDAWYLECDKNRPAQANPRVMTHRDALLATIALTYGQIDYSAGSRPLNAEDAFKRMLKMLETEHHPFIRSAIVLAMALQVQDHFEMVEGSLRGLLPEVTSNERQEIVKILKEVYLQQRAQLKGGDDKMKLGDETYKVWTDPSKRRFTKVEQALYRWLEMEGNVAARQIATQAFVEFAVALDQPEREFIKKQMEEAEHKKQASPQARPISQAQLAQAIRQLTVVQRAAAYFATRNAADLRPIVNDVLPEAWEQYRSRPVATEFVIEKWKTVPAELVNRAAKHLYTALRLVHYSPLIIFGLSGLVVIFSCCLWMLSLLPGNNW